MLHVIIVIHLMLVLALIVAWSKRCALCCVNSCCSSGCCDKGAKEGSCCSSEKSASTGCCGGNK